MQCQADLLRRPVLASTTAGDVRARRRRPRRRRAAADRAPDPRVRPALCPRTSATHRREAWHDGRPALPRGDPPAGGEPAMTPTPLLRLMTKVARLYYEQGLRQAEIADQLDLCQSRVSRLLKQAEKEGIVRITVAVPQGFHAELEDRLQVLYGLREAVVVDCEHDDDQEALRAIGAAARRVPGDDADGGRDPRHLELERVAAVDARQHAPAGAARRGGGRADPRRVRATRRRRATRRGSRAGSRSWSAARRASCPRRAWSARARAGARCSTIRSSPRRCAGWRRSRWRSSASAR